MTGQYQLFPAVALHPVSDIHPMSRQALFTLDPDEECYCCVSVVCLFAVDSLLSQQLPFPCQPISVFQTLDLKEDPKRQQVLILFMLIQKRREKN